VKHDLLSPFDRSLFDSAGPVNVSLLVLALVIVAAVAALAGRIRDRHPSEAPPGKLRDAALLFLGLTYGVSCLLSALGGEFLAPDLVGDGSALAMTLIWGSGITGVLLALGLFTRPAAWISLALFVAAVTLRPFEAFDGQPVSIGAALNYLDVVGIAAFLGLAGRGRFALDSLVSKAPSHAAGRATATALLRLALGLTLVLLGMQKFLHPELPMGVVQNYGDAIFEPFQRLFGVSEELYVFGAALVEFTVGLVLLVGVFTRVVMLVLAVLFSATLFIFQGEVLGHMPLFGIVVLLLVEGGGRFRLFHDRSLPSGFGRGISGGLGSAAALLLVGLLSGCAQAAEAQLSSISLAGPEAQGAAEGRHGAFDFALRFEEPGLGELFQVETLVRDHSSGELISGGSLTLDCTMPAHGHGMMTAPKSQPKSDGSPGFTTAGMKLHMYGAWVFDVAFEAGGRRDAAQLNFDFQPAG
jgi:uncharacterized membrane protein YphA (DoxX/SURF4 family)